MTIDELKAEVARLTDESLAAEERLKAASAELANAQAEFSVGERVMHRGKLTQVTAIHPGYSWSQGPRYKGRMVKKDGSLGLVETELWSKLSKVESA